MSVRVLHVGCGRKKWAAPDLFNYIGLGLDGSDAEVMHIDADPELQPDRVCKLGTDYIPLQDDSVDLIVAWHVLEHIGRQGETAEWFYAFEEMYRVLKPDGWLYGECPYYSGLWAWSDPTHTRVLSESSFVFFSQASYRIPDNAISPYRIRCDFKGLGLSGMEQGYAVITDPKDARNQMLRFCLTAVKPLKPWWED